MKKKVFQLKEENGIGIITFNVTEDKTNTWTEDAFADLTSLIEELEKNQAIRGVIFISGKPDNFIAGANLKLISQIKQSEAATARVERFHRLMARLGALSFPVVAAIHGHCLGGGLEFTLACTARIAKEGKSTFLGLPECKVGLFPGGGGTQRLPRLIGYAAIDLIMTGSMVSAAKALELGIVDRVVPPEGDLLKEAKEFLEEIIAGRVGLKRPDHDFGGIDDRIEEARKKVLKASRGRALPGPMLALKAIGEGLKKSLQDGLEIEKKNFVEAVLSKEAKGSIHTFFLKTLTDRAANMVTKGYSPQKIDKIGVLGFGTMGRGIVIDILRNTKICVLVKDVQAALEPGQAFVRKILEGMAEKKRLKEPVEQIMTRLTAVSDFGDDFSSVDFVIEAVFEDMKVKKQVYEELNKVVRPDCVIASNTSSIPITSMSAFVTLPERFGGLHFFSPVWLMQLVEVIRGEKTSQNTVDNLLSFASLIRKRPIVCRDNSGFVVNALLGPYLMGSLKYIEEGNRIEDVDGSMLEFGMPIGPIRLLDEVGIDVPYKAQLNRGNIQKTLKNVVETGYLGLKKSGKGFFLKDGSVDPDVLPLIERREPHVVSRDEIQRGLLTVMVTAGKDLLERKIVDDVRMIDVGMIWGTGFPADKGGPMKWADLTGISRKVFGTDFY